MSRAAVVLCVAALALSGCGDKDEPTKSPTPTPTASSNSPSPSASASSASPSASASTSSAVPAAARERTEAGAIAFLTFYFDVVNDGYQDPAKPPDLFAYADKDCVSCKKAQAHFAEYAKGGWSVKQDLLRVVGPSMATKATDPKVIINCTLEEAAVPLFKDGRPTKEATKASAGSRGVALKWVNDSWQIFDIEQL